MKNLRLNSEKISVNGHKAKFTNSGFLHLVHGLGGLMELKEIRFSCEDVEDSLLKNQLEIYFEFLAGLKKAEKNIFSIAENKKEHFS